MTLSRAYLLLYVRKTGRHFRLFPSPACGVAESTLRRVLEYLPQSTLAGTFFRFCCGVAVSAGFVSADLQSAAAKYKGL